MVDIKALLTKILESIYVVGAWAQIYKSSFTANNTAAKVTGTTIWCSNNSSKYFTAGTDSITINKAGVYKITVGFRLSAATNNTNVKRLALYKNGTELVTVLGRDNAWNDRAQTYTATLAKNDVLTMYARAEDGNSTYSFGRIIIEPISNYQ